VSLAVQKVAEEKGKVLAISMASSRDISGKSCSPNGMQFANDGYSVANLTIKGAAATKPNTWYFLTVDYAAGHSIEKDSQRMIEDAGGKFIGSSRFPLGSPDFSSFLLQAQASKAHYIAFIGGGADMINAIKQAAEFGLQSGAQQFVPFSVTTDDVFAVGSKTAAGLPVILSFYWDETPATRAWTERFKKASGGKMPTDPQANVYSAVLHYLKAVKAVGSTDTKAVLAKMKSTPVDDFFTKGARIREDGRVMRPLYYGLVKAPNQMKNPTDLLTLAKKFSGEEAFIPAAMSECPLLKK
jgi:branched-chain amino acid transport system substrate-binding protein